MVTSASPGTRIASRSAPMNSVGVWIFFCESGREDSDDAVMPAMACLYLKRINRNGKGRIERATYQFSGPVKPLFFMIFP